jgi:Flavin containing amine oxidoreductase
MVWAIPSYLTSAEDYRTYLSYSFAEHEPPFWLASGSAYRQVIEPLKNALEARGVEIVTSVQLTSISCTGGRATEIGLQGVRFDQESYGWVGEGDAWTDDVDELILAVPQDVLSHLVRTGPQGGRVVEAAPKVAEVSRLSSQPIPIVHLFFSKKLEDIPPEPVGLYGSSLALAFTDISQTWEDVTEVEGQTVLSVSASEPHGLPRTGPHEDGFEIIRQLSEYLNFDPGAKWGESSAIDWAQTRYEPNTDAELFVNETGTDVWRPKAACDGVTNLSFAGDFCANRIGMTTIESAVTTGLEAARVVVERRGIGGKVEIAEPEPGSEALFLWLRWAWMPYVAAAKTWSAGSDCAGRLRRLLTPTRPPARQRRES